MIRFEALRGLGIARALGLAMGLLIATTAEGGSAHRARSRAYVPTTRTIQPGAGPSPMLGTFVGTPYMIVRGNAPVGGGYTPLGQYGENSLALFGPLSPLRATTAPVLVYTRGYDGRTRVTDGIGFSTPNLPEISPIVYPTKANTSYYGFRRSNTPPQWDNANWLDQN